MEAAFAPDGRHAYVSNYSMYGPGFGPEGSDVCSPASGYDRSFVYRIPLASLEIDALPVGAVPKVVAVTRDGRYVLASNWCSYDLSVISTRRGREVRRVPIGAYRARDRRLPDGRRLRRRDGWQRDRAGRPRRLVDRRLGVGAGPRACRSGRAAATCSRPSTPRGPSPGWT